MKDNAILKFIKTCVAERRIFWTYHVNMRMKGRFVPRETIINSFDTYEIIEQYPEDKYLPSYLVYAEHQGVPLHIVFAVDKPGRNVIIVTAYRPDSIKWLDDFKKRRNK